MCVCIKPYNLKLIWNGHRSSSKIRTTKHGWDPFNMGRCQDFLGNIGEKFIHLSFWELTQLSK